MTTKMRDASTGRLRKVHDTFDSTRIRYNGGYHDGAQAQRNGWRHKLCSDNLLLEKHFDQAYAYGYLAGKKDQAEGIYNENSTKAWERDVENYSYLQNKYAPYRVSKKS